MQIDHSQKKLLITLVLAVGAFVSLGWYPAHRDIGTLSEEVQSIQKQIDGFQGKTVGHAALFAEVQRMEAELASTSKVIPQQNELAGLIREISTRIDGQALGERELNTRPTVESDHYVTLPIDIACTGDSLSAFHFVNDLESMPQLVQLSGLYMSVDPKDPSHVKTELKVNTFFYAKPEERVR